MKSFPKTKRSKIRITTPDKHFSKIIRIRDCTSGEYGPCITCGKIIHWKKGHCGHFATRDHPMTRFDERNCHLQCVKCNSFKDGEQVKHGFAIDKLYGEGTAQKLIKLSEIRGQKFFTKPALKQLATQFKDELRILAYKKGIEL